MAASRESIKDRVRMDEVSKRKENRVRTGERALLGILLFDVERKHFIAGQSQRETVVDVYNLSCNGSGNKE